MAGVAGGRRALAQLLRSFPGYRIGEQMALGGRRPYPESLPIPGLERPMATRAETRAAKGANTLGLLGQLTGLDPSTIDAVRTANLGKEGLEAARSRVKAQRKTLRKKLRNPNY